MRVGVGEKDIQANVVSGRGHRFTPRMAPRSADKSAMTGPDGHAGELSEKPGGTLVPLPGWVIKSREAAFWLPPIKVSTV